jgi:hypothetical protein
MKWWSNYIVTGYWELSFNIDAVETMLHKVSWFKKENDTNPYFSNY